MLTVQQWAELRRLHLVEKVPVRELARRFDLDRNTVRTAVRSADPPKYSRAPRPSKLDPFKDELHRLLKDDARIPAPRLRELLEPLGYAGGETILKEHLREVRPLFDPPRTFQRTAYLPGELAQCDLWEPAREIPVGYGQTRRGYVVTVTLCFSRVSWGTLIFSKEAVDINAGLLRCLVRIGGLPKKLVWDREGAIHKGAGRPTDAFAAFCAQLGVGWLFLAPRDPQAKGVEERGHRYLRTSFEPARAFGSPADFQLQLDGWYDDHANVRFHQTLRARPVDRFAQERDLLRPLPAVLPIIERREVLRVPPQPYARVDTADYSLDPGFVGRRVELRVSQTEVAAVALDTGELVCRHARTFARHVTVTAVAHQQALDRQRAARRAGPDVPVERRPLEAYDRLIPA
ncbi:MAG: IS21 family transposase [Candidatus Limnocylindria bacterium]